jgi:hypothetical protein
MNEITVSNSDTLPAMIDRAANALTSARSSAEVLEARDYARVAYDAAKSAGRMAKAKGAHDVVIAAVYRAQADAAVIEARAKIRLADEYDAAQERGEVAMSGQRSDLVADGNEVKPTTADLGIRRDEIHEARKLRDAEAAAPGKIEAAADALIARGEEPTKAALRREVVGVEKPVGAKEPDQNAKLRAEFRRMTPEGQEDDWIALRIEIAENRRRIQSQTSQIADLKQAVNELSAGSDLGAKLSAKVRELGAMRLKRDDAMTEVKRMEYRMKKAEKERDEAIASLQSQIIPL